jgi:flagellar basal-body rod protein FlgB
MDIFRNAAAELLVRAMDAAALRNQVLANNIANADTPGFKRQSVMFEELLRAQAAQAEPKNGLPLRLTHRRHLDVKADEPLPEPAVVREIGELSYRNDGNNVDFDVESVQIAQNKLLYDAYVQCYSSEQALLKTAITGRSS